MAFRIVVILGLLSTVFVACGDDDPKPIDAPDVVVDMSTIDAPPSACGGTKVVTEACTTNEECYDCMCMDFGHGSMTCTKVCTANSQCPAPSLGCTKNNGEDGICRPGP